jgi:hypothetical protein
MLTFAAGVEFASQKFERSQAGILQSDASERATTAQQILALNKLAVVWQQRTDLCEAKFKVGTIIYEPRPAATLPLAHGLLSLTLNGGAAGIPSPAVPAWYIPAQVPVYSKIPGAMYSWQDMRTVETKGPFAATAPGQTP